MSAADEKAADEADARRPTTDAVVEMIRGLRGHLSLSREAHLPITIQVHPQMTVNREAFDAVERSENVTITLVPYPVLGPPSGEDDADA